MLDLEERNRARKKAMRLLEHMDRTEKGLTDKLRQAEYLLPHGNQEPSEDPLGTSVKGCGPSDCPGCLE